LTLYRFYGARHSILQLGYLIDFEIEEQKVGFLPKIRNITHHPFSWLYNKNRLLLWHQFILELEKHLKEITKIEPFYFNLLLEMAKKATRQSIKRVIVEGVLKILEFEGRLYHLDRCVTCNKEIENEVSLIKNFLPTHPNCSNLIPLNKKDIKELFISKSTINLYDEIVDILYSIVSKGF